MKYLHNWAICILALGLFPLSSAFAETANRGVRVDILPGPVLKVLDIMELRLTSPIAGYLILIDIDKDGRATKLFPGICKKPDLKLRANAPLIMPTADFGCQFPAIEPGEGQIIAIVSIEKVTLKELASAPRSGGAVHYRGIDVETTDGNQENKPFNKDKKESTTAVESQVLRDREDLASHVRRVIRAWESGVDGWSLGLAYYTIVK